MPADAKGLRNTGGALETLVRARKGSGSLKLVQEAQRCTTKMKVFTRG